MNKLQVFENELFKVSAKTEGEEILFDVEEVAKSLGFTEVKNNKTYIRWRTVNGYLTKYVSQEVAKGDLIPEPLVYKLAFKASNEVAEQFQDWLAIEVIPQIRKTGSYDMDTSKLSPELQMFKQIFDSVALTQLKQQEQDKRLSSVEKKQDNLKEVLSLNPTEWRNKVKKIIVRIGTELGGGAFYQQMWKESYDLLEQRARCDLSIRRTNKRRRMAEKGDSESKRNRVSKLDVIAEDARLTEIYLAVVKEMAIKYDVEMESDAS